MQVLLTTTRAWYLNNTAKALHQRNALAGLWMADKNASGLPAEKYRRCWPYHACLKPFYHCTPQIWSERATYFSFMLIPCGCAPSFVRAIAPPSMLFMP